MIISDTTLTAIREIPFTTILQKENISFKKIGKEAVTLCPWHNDSNPSMTVSDEKNLCYCFVCQYGTDTIGFLQQKLGLDFSDAVHRIANCGDLVVEYDNIDPKLAVQEAKRRAELFDKTNRQQENFRKNITDARAIRIHQILEERDIAPSTSRHFGLGYAIDGFFADRITVPIHDHQGYLVGFTGRATRDEAKPKYKNSENGEIFDKSRIVYNEYRASEAIREADSVIFVEGHFDVISLWQHGIRNVVAMQGTAPPSEAILKRLSRKTKRFILCYDSDEGGTKAIENFIKVAGPAACRGEITISVAELPDGMDPDECIRDESIDFFSIIENSVSWLDWQLDVWLANVDRTDTAKFIQIETSVRQLVESINSPSLRQYYIDKASKILAANQKSAAKIAKEWSENIKVVRLKRTWTKPTPAETRIGAEKKLLRMYIHIPELREECRKLMDRLQSPSHRWLWQRINELEEHDTRPLEPEAVMAVLAVCEPYYTRQLRPIAVPTIKVLNNSGILKHIQKTLSEELTINGI
jgi:DNA primase